MFTVTMQMQGLGKALENLREVDKRVARKVLPKGIRAGAKVLAKVAKAEAPVDTGTLRKSMWTRVKSYQGGKRVQAIVGPRRFKYANGKNPANYAHLVELGHRVANRGKLLRVQGKGKNTKFKGGQGKMLGRAKGNPFMSRAANAADNMAIATFTAVATAEILAGMPAP